MGNFSSLLFLTLLSAMLWSGVKPCSEKINEDINTCLRLRDDVTEIKEMLRKMDSEIVGIREEIQKPCADDPPPIRNGKATNFERSHGSRVRYECDRNFVVTGNSTVRCVSGAWQGHPPACSYFDATFYAVMNYGGVSSYIECHSDSNADKIRFSRFVDTGRGGDLPTNATLTTSEKSVRMDFEAVKEWRDRRGVYRCGFEAEEGSADAVVPNQSSSLSFPDASKVASVGDNVTLRLRVLEPYRILWSRDGRRLPSWDGRTEVSIHQIKAEDAGVYSARFETEPFDRALLLLSVRKCKANLYGERCDQVCPPCHNGGICHDLLGICVCPDGFVGSNCETPCPEGFHGPDCSTACGLGKCGWRLFCKQHPFGCACGRGYTETACQGACDPGWYGVGCKQPCHCAEGGDCNRFTGACSEGCAPGWKGLSCQIKDDE